MDKLRHYIFRIELGASASEHTPEALLEKAGVTIDKKFGRVAIDADGRSQILRGVATELAVAEAKRRFNIDAFVDAPVHSKSNGD